MNAELYDVNVMSISLFSEYPEYIQKLMDDTKYPWEIMNNIGIYISKIYQKCLNEDFFEYKDGVLIGKGTIVAETACICAPAIIGRDCEIRHCAYIRGNVITGKGCVIGNSSEIKNSVILDYAQLPHYNYVGDSVIGNYAHMGAGAICSNLKSDKSIITVKTDPVIDTKLKKFGSAIGDKAEIGCGCVLNPGTVVGMNTRIYPLTTVRGIVPENSIMKSASEIVEIN